MYMSETPLTDAEVNQLGMLELAFIGDTVCDLFVREHLIRLGYRAHKMHELASRLVNAQAQADALECIRPLLTEEEAAVARRGQNVKAHHPAPHGVDVRIYNRSTAFEALLGTLYMAGRTERLKMLLTEAMKEKL